MESQAHVQVWHKCLDIIKDNVPSVSFRTWFLPIVPLRLKDNILTIQVPSPFFYEYLEEQYIGLLRKTLYKVLGQQAKLEYSVVMENTKQANASPVTVNYPGKNRTVSNSKPVSMPLNVNDSTIKNPFIIPGIQQMHVDPQLNPDNNFNTFIEGQCNRLVRSAGVAVAQNPGKTSFNPLFIHGESGLGKTHLAQAIGIDVKERFPDKIVLYVTANKFQTQYGDAVRKNTRNDFMHFYQMIDVLIIDDIQELNGKKSQESFFHIFNHLHQAGKQLILTSDQPPVELKGLSKRLLSRFKWGLSAEVKTPDYETRKAILKQMSYKDGMNISEDVLSFIASNVHNNVRELEGSLISVLAQATFNKKEITIDLAKEQIKNLVNNQKQDISITKIQKIICEHFNMDTKVLQSKTRKREIVQARQVAMYFSKNLTDNSLASIGAQLGGKGHATVLHACKTVSNLYDIDKNFKQTIDDIERKLHAN